MAIQRITILREMPYRGTNVYVQHYDTMFQYFFSWENKVYQQHLFMKPKRRSKANMLPAGMRYTQQELEYAEQVLLSGAMQSIDLMADKNAGVLLDVPLNK